MNSLDTAKSAPLEDKLRSYVAALAMIHSASAEVVKGCRALVAEQLPTLSQLLGVTAATKDIKDEVLPAKIREFGAGWASIGVKVDLVPSKLWFCIGLYIDETGDTNQHVEAYAGIYVATLAKANPCSTLSPRHPDTRSNSTMRVSAYAPWSRSRMMRSAHIRKR